LLDVEFVHLECDSNLLENDDVQLTIVEVQVQQCIPHNMTSICWGFFVINDNLLIDFENPQMLLCTIYQSKQIVGNILNQLNCILKKWFIKYNKKNNINPMKTHIDYAHPYLTTKSSYN
jgi:hypothetical protein